MNHRQLDLEYLKSLTVLYVEDDDDLREELAHYLRRLVGKLLVAFNGAVGLEAFRQERPQLVVTDILMPVLTGLEMAEAIRAVDAAVPIVVITAFEQSDYLLRSIEIGVDKYVTKPLDVERLESALLSCAHRLRAEAQLALQRQRETEGLRQHQAHLEEEVEKRTADLQEANIALKILLKNMEQTQSEFEQKVATNIVELVSPYLEKLQKSGLSERQADYLGIVTTNLQEIVTPGSRSTAAMHRRFTPTEIKIANLVKQGKSSKEISEILNLAPRTIEKNRQNIRRKVGITNQKTNLRSLLSTPA